MGAKKKPFYRIVVADKQSPRDGRFIESIGTYNPLTEPETVDLQHDRAAHWLSVGAQPSEAVARLLQNAKLLDENGKPLPFDPSNYMAEVAASATAAVESVVEEVVAKAEEVAADVSDAVEAATEKVSDALGVSDGENSADSE